MRLVLSCSPSEWNQNNPFLLFQVKNILSTHLYPTGWKFPDKQKCIEMSKIILVLLWQQIQLLLISWICSCLFCFLQKLICRKKLKLKKKKSKKYKTSHKKNPNQPNNHIETLLIINDISQCTEIKKLWYCTATECFKCQTWIIWAIMCCTIAVRFWRIILVTH